MQLLHSLVQLSCRVQATPALTSRALMLHTGRSLFGRPIRTAGPLSRSASVILSEPLRDPLKLRSRTARQTCIRITRSRLLQLLRAAPARLSRSSSESARIERGSSKGDGKPHTVIDLPGQGSSPVSSRSKRHAVRSADCLTAWRNLPVGVNQHQPLVIASGCV